MTLKVCLSINFLTNRVIDGDSRALYFIAMSIEHHLNFWVKCNLLLMQKGLCNDFNAPLMVWIQEHACLSFEHVRVGVSGVRLEKRKSSAWENPHRWRPSHRFKESLEKTFCVTLRVFFANWVFQTQLINCFSCKCMLHYISFLWCGLQLHNSVNCGTNKNSCIPPS